MHGINKTITTNQLPYIQSQSLDSDGIIPFNPEMFVSVSAASVFTVCVWQGETQTVETGTVLCA